MFLAIGEQRAKAGWALTLLMLFTMAVNGMGQNLVPNPSFEDTVACPTGSGQIYNSVNWTTFCLSPDYYHTCNSNPFDVSVPNNWAGYQQPASGNAYVGFGTYSNSGANTREYPACTLSSPLNIGVKYYISFKVSLALSSFIQANCASNKIGAMFTKGIYPCNITNNPPVYTDSIITDSLNWTRITGSFVADSAYTYLVIGNFFDDANTDTVKFFNDFSDNAYYYLDDVCVGTDSNYVYNYSYTTGINENNIQTEISCYPNPIRDNLTIQNSSNKKIDITIYNVLGELLYSVQNILDRTFSIDLSDTKQGILLINIKSENQITNYKLFKL